MISIAFASSDRDTVNEHFGAASAFAILEIDETSSRLREVAEFIDTAMDGHEGKLDAKIALLDGCAAVYACAIGGSAVQRLLAKGVQPVKTDEGTRIDALVKQLQAEIAAGPTGWLAKAMNPKDGAADDRFAAMADEGWEE
jgi:nitrogen fixation protein NifX